MHRRGRTIATIAHLILLLGVHCRISALCGGGGGE
jgi:hypothetical protein